MEGFFLLAGPVYFRIFVQKYDVFITYLLRIIICSSMHKLKLDFVNGLIYPMGLIFLTNLNVIHFRKSVCDVVYLRCCSFTVTFPHVNYQDKKNGNNITNEGSLNKSTLLVISLPSSYLDQVN